MVLDSLPCSNSSGDVLCAGFYWMSENHGAPQRFVSFSAITRPGIYADTRAVETVLYALGEDGSLWQRIEYEGRVTDWARIGDDRGVCTP